MLDRLTVRAALGAFLIFSLANASSSRAGEFVFVDEFEDTATLTGRVLDTNAFVDGGIELPVEGVVVTLLELPDVSVTGPDGSFILRNVPPGEQVLDLDTGGATPAPTGDNYAGFRERIVLNGFNNVERPFYLPRIDASSLTTIDPTQTTVVENPNLEISMTVAAGSAIDEDGQMFDGQLSISEVPAGLAPAALPDFLEPGLLITVQPVGVTFSPPAPITFPNFDNLPPGSETDLWSLDPELGEFAIVGTGQVSADGQRIETISGGIVAADWHAPPPPPPREGDGDGDGPPDCDGCCPSCSSAVGSSVDLFNGEFSETLRLPGVMSLNREFAPEFVYQSKRAFPLSVVPVNSGIVSRAAIPNLISYRGFIDGELVQDEIFIDTTTLTQRGVVGPPADEPFRVAVPFDNTSRATGIHDANVMVTSIYDRSRISAVNPSALTVVNEIDSPFGAGWSLAGLDRLILDAPGTIRERLLLVKGDGGSIQFEEQLSGVNPDGIITIVIKHNTACCWDIETAALIAILDGMGLASQLIVGTDFTPEVVDASRLVILMDFTFGHDATDPVIQQIADVTKLAQDNGVPTFYIGEEPAFLGSTAQNPEFVDLWLGLWNLQLASASAGGEGVVTVTDAAHPIFDGPAGALTQFNVGGGAGVGGDVDVTRGSNTGETTIAESATADIVLVEESSVGGRNVTMNSTIGFGQPVADRDELALIVENAVAWLLQSPSLTSGFFGEGQFAAVDGDYSGIVRDPATGTFTRVLRDGTLHLFDAEGRMVSTVDRNGNTTSYAYDGAARIQTITDPVGRATSFAYDGNGRLASVTDAAGRVTGFEVDAAGNLVEVTFPDGSMRGFDYDARHLMTSQTSPRGLTTQYEYDGLGFFTQSTQPDGSVRQVSPAQTVGLVDTSGGQGTMANPATVTRPEMAISGFVDPEGRMLIAETGSFGEPTNVVSPGSFVTILDRDENGNSIRTTLPSGHTLGATFDSRGNRLSATDEILGGTFNFTYETSFQQLEKITDPFGMTTILTHDAAGNPTSVTSPEGRVDTFGYSAEGFLETFVDRFGSTTTFTYDANGLVAQVDQGSGAAQRTMTVIRNLDGSLDQIIDAENRTTSLGHDDNGRPTSLILADGQTILNARDEDGNLITLTPPGKPAHGFTYTEAGQLASYQPPSIIGGGDTTYTYNLAQQLTRIDRPDGRAVVQTYDTAGRLVTREIARGTTTFGYDDATGQLITIDAGDEDLAFSYQGEFLASEAWSGTVSGTTSRTYAADGVMVAESINAASQVSYAYDDDRLLISAGEISITRDSGTGLISDTALDQVSDASMYNEFGELVAYQAWFNGTLLYEFTLSRDRLGRIVSKTETIQGTASTYTYTYDLRGQLERVDKDAALAAGYTYDANGNRLSRNDGVDVETGNYDDQDRANSYGAISYTYRQSGELLSKTESSATTTYDYDEQGNLLSVTRPDGVVISYVIDGVDRRVGKKIDGSLIQGLIYKDTLNPIAEFDGAGNLVSRFVYASRENVPDYMIQAGGTYRLITDQVGSVRLVVDVVNGTIAQRLDYDEFGRVLVDTNPGFQPFGFAGGLYDPDTDLVRFGVRDYDAFSGRWTAKDPILFSGGTTNLYAYVDNQPINQIDPTGLRTSNESPGISGSSDASTRANVESSFSRNPRFEPLLRRELARDDLNPSTRRKLEQVLARELAQARGEIAPARRNSASVSPDIGNKNAICGASTR